MSDADESGAGIAGSGTGTGGGGGSSTGAGVRPSTPDPPLVRPLAADLAASASISLAFLVFPFLPLGFFFVLNRLQIDEHKQRFRRKTISREVEILILLEWQTAARSKVSKINRRGSNHNQRSNLLQMIRRRGLALPGCHRSRQPVAE